MSSFYHHTLIIIMHTSAFTITLSSSSSSSSTHSATTPLPYDVDLLFIDTWHVYGHLKRELALHAPRVRRFIAMHDTEVDKDEGESIRMGYDIPAQVVEYGYVCGCWSWGLRNGFVDQVFTFSHWVAFPVDRLLFLHSLNQPTTLYHYQHQHAIALDSHTDSTR